MLNPSFRLTVTRTVLIIGVISIAGLAIYVISAAIEQPFNQSADGLWNDPIYDWMKVVGPVESVLIEATDEAPDEDWTELPRYPMMRFEYDRQGRLVTKRSFSSDRSSSPPAIYLYNNAGQLIKETYYKVDGKPYIETAYSYGSQGRLLEAVSYQTEWDRLLSKEIYTYDPKNNYVEVTEYWDKSLRSKTGYVRDANGRVIEQLYLSTLAQGQASLTYAGKTVLSYGENGNVIEELLYDASGKLESKKSISYEYDSYGNWTKKITVTEQVKESESSEPVKDIIYRTINYYQ